MEAHTSHADRLNARYANLHKTIVTLGQTVLDEKLGIYTDHCELLFDADTIYRHTILPAHDNISVSGPHHGHDPQVALTIGQGKTEPNPPYYIFWNDGSVVRAHRDVFAHGHAWRDHVEPVSVHELHGLKRALTKARLASIAVSET